MANTASAKKRARQSLRRRERNTAYKSKVRSAIVGARELLGKPKASKDLEKAVTNAVAALSKAANRGIIHHRQAARKISRLMKAANSKTAV